MVPQLDILFDGVFFDTYGGTSIKWFNQTKKLIPWYL
jgi:hypothetical protein